MLSGSISVSASVEKTLSINVFDHGVILVRDICGIRKVKQILSRKTAVLASSSYFNKSTLKSKK